MKYLKLIILLNLFLLVFSCGTLKEGFKNQKKNNSDEFLVEKKSPLVMPPDYKDLPTPNITQPIIKKKSDEIKLLITQEENLSSSKEDNTDKNFEETLLEKIKKN
tara:strand:+ start:216 stop:530 length:315 start_codon:yes stop_codon:yes gene_type:complete